MVRNNSDGDNSNHKNTPNSVSLSFHVSFLEYTMKHALLVATFAASAVISVAQKPATTSVNPASSVPMTLTPADLTPQGPIKAEETTQGVLFKRVFTTDVRSQFHYWPFGTISRIKSLELKSVSSALLTTVVHGTSMS
jgi:hypothetical protein